MTKEDIENAIKDVMHPAIDLSLLELGIISDVLFAGGTAQVVFAFPFPNIPIADQLIGSIAAPIQKLGVDFEHSIRIMSESEKARFLQLEGQAWKGL